MIDTNKLIEDIRKLPCNGTSGLQHSNHHTLIGKVIDLIRKHSEQPEIADISDARALVGELVEILEAIERYNTRPNYATACARHALTKAQAFMEGLDNATK